MKCKTNQNKLKRDLSTSPKHFNVAEVKLRKWNLLKFFSLKAFHEHFCPHVYAF